MLNQSMGESCVKTWSIFACGENRQSRMWFLLSSKRAYRAASWSPIHVQGRHRPGTELWHNRHVFVLEQF